MNIFKYIPLSTVLLAIAMFAFMIKVLVEGKIKLILHPFMRYFFYACAFLAVLMLLFYPFFFHYYQMQASSNLLLLSNIVKYSMLFILVANYLLDKKKFKNLNIGFIISLSIIILLSFLL